MNETSNINGIDTSYVQPEGRQINTRFIKNELINVEQRISLIIILFILKCEEISLVNKLSQVLKKYFFGID